MATSAESSSNSLGLELEALKISDAPEQSQAAETAPATETVSEGTPEASQPTGEPEADAEGAAESPTGDEPSKSDGKKAETKDKKKPYVNPERVKTGGPQREKLTEDELTERMARIREQNEKIKQRRVDVQADEDAFKKMQEADKARMARTKKVQAHVDLTREQNARRKMDKISNREWDSGKKPAEWKPPRPTGEEGGESAEHPTLDIRSAVRGGERGRGRGRGRPGDRTGAPRNNHGRAAGDRRTTNDGTGDGPSDDKPTKTAPVTAAAAA